MDDLGSQISSLSGSTPKKTSKNKKLIPFMGRNLTENDLFIEILNYDQATFKALLDLLSEAYHNDVPYVSDATYDMLEKIYENKYEPYIVVGAKVRGNKVILPYYLSSLKKLKEEKELSNWKKRYPGPYVVEDKVDGLTVLYVQKGKDRKIFTRGDGAVGENVTRHLPYLDIPMAPQDIAIRGEIVMFNDDFKKYGAPKYDDPRSMVSGLINAKTSIRDLLKYLHFLPFRIVTMDTTPEEQIEQLMKWGYDTPYAAILDDLDFNMLRSFILERKAEAPYNMDGLVVYQNKIINYPTKDYPRQVMAFKLFDETAYPTTVIRVEWNASKDYKLKPTVYYDNTKIQGRTFEAATGINARFIVNNDLGPGATIRIAIGGEIIPKIVQILKGSPDGPSLPDEKIYGPYHWDANKTELITTKTTNDVRIAKLQYFLDKLGIMGIGPGRLKLMVEAGILTVRDLLDAKPTDFAKLERIGMGVAQNMYNSIHSKITDVPLSLLMPASGLFPGLGEKKIEVILSEHPDILTTKDSMDDLTKKIAEIKGFSSKTADSFVRRLPAFKKWLKDHPEITYIIQYGVPMLGQTATSAAASPGRTRSPSRSPSRASSKSASKDASKDTPLVGVNVTFSGFRDDNLKRKIIERGGKVGDSVSRSTTHLVLRDVKDIKGKGQKAVTLGIPLVSLVDFIQRYQLQA